MKIPYIESKWKKLFKPKKFGNYVNDHTLYQDQSEKWHLIGITSKGGNPSCEKYFVHAVSDSLDHPMKETGKVIDTGTLAWAPGVIFKDGAYYMFYGPSPTKLAVSPDSVEWFGTEVEITGLPPMACHRDHYVIIAGGKYLMYASGIDGKRGSICVLESEDLLRWKFCGFALTSGEKAELRPAWGAFESPYVIRYEDLYYLFTTYTDCSKKTYHNTLVFCSSDPYDFGCYNSGVGGAVPIAILRAHAPEIINEGGLWRITTCGWRKSSFVKGAVAIANLAWKDAEDR